jgi:hypothetical protein
VTIGKINEPRIVGSCTTRSNYWIAMNRESWASGIVTAKDTCKRGCASVSTDGSNCKPSAHSCATAPEHARMSLPLWGVKQEFSRQRTYQLLRPFHQLLGTYGVSGVIMRRFTNKMHHTLEGNSQLAKGRFILQISVPFVPALFPTQ